MIGRGQGPARSVPLLVGLVAALAGLLAASLFPDHVDDRFLARIPESGMPLSAIAGNDVPLGLEIFSVYGAIQEETRATVLLVGSEVPRTRFSDLRGLNDLLLAGVADVEEVRPLGRPGPPPPDVAPTRRGDTSWGSGTWLLWLADAEADVLVASGTDRGDLVLVDARLLPPGTLPADATTPGPTRDSPRPVGPATAVALDAVLLYLLMVLGGAILPRSVPPAARFAAGFAVGLAALAATGPLLLGGVGGLALAAAVLAGGAIAMHRRSAAIGWAAPDRRSLAAAAVVVVAVAAVGRLTGFVRVATDEVLYLAGGRALAMGSFSPALVDPKRGVGIQALHAPSFALGAEGFHSLGLALLVATALLIRSAAVRAGAPRAVGDAAAALVLASPSYRALAALLNSHAAVGLVLLALVVLPLVVERRQELTGVPGRGTPALAALAAGLVVLRPEGVMLAGLVLAAAAPELRRGPTWRWAWWATGLALTGLHLVLIRGAIERGEALPSLSLLLLPAGVMLIVAPALLRRAPGRVLAVVPTLTLGALWLVVAALTAAAERTTFWSAVRENLLLGRGAWGVLGPVVIALVVAATAVVAAGPSGAEDDRLRVGLGVTLGFVPVAFVAKLLDSTSDRVLDAPLRLLDEIAMGSVGRIGWGDSVNRMWTHLVPTALLVAVVVLGGRRRGVPARSRRRTPALLAGAVGLALVASAWRPTQLLPAVRTVPVVSVDGGAGVTGEVDRGTTIVQTVRVRGDLADEVAGLTAPRLCVALTFGTFGRRDDATIEVALRTGGRERVTEVEAAELPDNAPWETCTAVEAADLGPELEIEVRGLDGAAGAAPALWTAPPSAGGFALERRADGRVIAHGEIAHRVVVRGDVVPAGRAVVHGIVRWAPWVTSLALIAALRPRRRTTLEVRPTGGAPEAVGTLPP